MATLSNTPSGNVDILTIMLMDQEFMLISAGPFFKFNPSVSTEAFLKMKKFDIAKLKEASD